MFFQPEMAPVANLDSLVCFTRNESSRVFLDKTGQDQFFDQVFNLSYPESGELAFVGVVGGGTKGAAFSHE